MLFDGESIPCQCAQVDDRLKAAGIALQPSNEPLYFRPRNKTIVRHLAVSRIQIVWS